MTRKSRDTYIIIGLICAALLQLLLLLAHSGVISFSSISKVEGIQAGQILSTHNQLRRRNMNSLLWESTHDEEPLYYHDSILTLKESTATLELNGQTDVTMSENTLITIDPPDADRAGEIRLRFQKGNLRARNPFKAAKLDGEGFTVRVKPGTDLEIREVASDQVEIQLKGGAAEVMRGGRMTPLATDRIIRVGQEQTDSLEISREFTFVNPPSRRIYLHGESTPVSLEWTGSADRLILQKIGQKEIEVPLLPNEQRRLVALAHGDYRLYLRRGDSSSAPIDLQVWPAPVIHLIQPLPRNRELLNQEISFLWQRHPGLARYNWILSRGTDRDQAQVQDNTLSRKFSSEFDGLWYVEGVDKDGFVTPPLYRYPIFLREKPFEAPRLRAPELRAPANKKEKTRGAWLWSLILPAAQADEVPRFEAEFAWEPVPGADQYVIEISESADFRNPIVNQTLKRSTAFLWRDFGFKKYYWRVAAGSSKGRLGVFSPPMGVDFSPLMKGPQSSIDGVLIRTIEAPKVAEVPAPPPKPAEPSGPSPKPPVEATIKPELGLIAFWRPEFSYMDVPGGDNVRGQFSGASPGAFALEVPWTDQTDSLWKLNLRLASRSFKPTDQDKYPFQEDLTWFDASADLIRFKTTTGVGGSVRRLMVLTREDYESVRTESEFWFGPALERISKLPRGSMHLKFEVLFTSGGQAFAATPEWRFKVGERMVTAVGVEGLVLLKAPEFGYIVNGYLSIGFPF